jgi:hypothetical protein
MLMLYATVLALATGAVSGGVTGSAYALATGQRPGLWLLFERDLATPIRIAVLVLHAPLLIAARAYDELEERPVTGLVLLGLAALWLFLQGVFILTQVFGIT